jgi:PAS domain S-box-containing protein
MSLCGLRFQRWLHPRVLLLAFWCGMVFTGVRGEDASTGREIIASVEPFHTGSQNRWSRAEAATSVTPWPIHPSAFGAIACSGIIIAAVITWAAMLRRRVLLRTRKIRERFARENALRRRYRELFESATDLILTHDLDGQITSFNPAGERLLGWNARELIGRPIQTIMAPAETDIAGGLVRPGGTTSFPGTATFQLDLRRRDGATVPFEVNSWLESQDGEPVGIQAICRDVSERLRAEEERARLERQLLETQKFESLGILAGGIAHDFNNLLTAVLGNASLARIELPDESRVQPCLAEIEIAAERAADLCSQMLAYSGRGRFFVSRLSLCNLVLENIELIQATVTRRARLELHLPENLPMVQGDATQLRQVLISLVSNAAEALGEGHGTVTIRVHAGTVDSAWLEQARFASDSLSPDAVFLDVSDTGSGMDPDTLRRVFEPFYTTKFTGRGLGLAAVLGIVRGHQGAIRIKTTPGLGTTFTIALSAITVAPDADRLALPSLALESRPASVLVVDDEDAVRKMIHRALEQMGCSVVTVPDGSAAVSAYLERSRPYDLVILDLTMPKMDGLETLRALRKEQPNLPVVLMSGFTERHATARFGEHRLAGFLQKPFSLEQFKRLVGSTLAVSAQSGKALKAGAPAETNASTRQR